MSSKSIKSNSLQNIIDLKNSISNKSIAFVSGNFNILHPGHLRILNFARSCADYLIVAVANNSSPDAFIDENTRLSSIKLINIIDFSFLLIDPIEDVLKILKPNIIVKGKEHENNFNIEKAILDGYGGKLLFSSGEVLFSSLDLLRNEFNLNYSNLIIPNEYITRHKLQQKNFLEIIDSYSKVNVLVIGDLIIDEYITCEALGMSREDPSIVVTPIMEDLYVGGAGIVASHASTLGANVIYFGISGDDLYSKFANDILTKNGIVANIFKDFSRPTTLKQRYRVQNKTLFRLSRLKQHDINVDLINKLSVLITENLKKIDIVIFSDFNYGCLPQILVNDIIIKCKQMNIPMVADSQSSSQSGDISRFNDMMLISPTEHEARISMRDSTSGLITLVDKLQRKCRAENIFITLASEGLLVYAPNNKSEILTDQLPALNLLPKDVAGAGDCMLTAAALSMVVGADIWTSAYIGSVASACQVGRVGNTPLSAKELKDALIR